jgi:hypothetical protein
MPSRQPSEDGDAVALESRLPQKGRRLAFFSGGKALAYGTRPNYCFVFSVA